MNKALLLIISILTTLSSFAQSPKLACECAKYSAASQPIDYNVLTELLNKGLYQEAIKTCESFLTTDPADRYSMQYMSEFLFYLSEIESGNLDPFKRRNMLYMDDAGVSDPEAYELYLIKSKIGPNPWTNTVKSKYLERQNCLNKCFQNSDPSDANTLTRRLAIFITTGNYSELISTMKNNDQSKIRINISAGEFYARFTERFVGIGEFEQGLNYLIEVKNKYGYGSETTSYWTSIYSTIIKNEGLSASLKQTLQAKIGKI